MESRSLQESHLLVTTMGWDSPPTHLRAVSEHVDAAGDVVHGALHPLRASRNVYKLSQTVSCDVACVREGIRRTVIWGAFLAAGCGGSHMLKNDSTVSHLWLTVL